MSPTRQKALIAVFVVIVAGTIGEKFWHAFYAQPLDVAEKQSEQLTGEIQKAQQTLRRLSKQQARLADLRRLSLPDDAETARTLYQGWLNDLAESVDLTGRRVDSAAPRLYDGYRVLPFSLRCEGTLEQLTSLLFGFYNGPYLHHIRSLTVAPIGGTRELNMNLSIEAVSVEGAARDRVGAVEAPAQLAGASLSDYQDIASRNVFSASGGVSAAQFTVLTAIVETDGYAEAWFTNGLEDEVDRVREGDRLRVSGLDCLVEKIMLRDLILSVDDQRWLITIDDSIADAIPLPPEY